MESSKPSKQRKAHYTRPLHSLQKKVGAALSKELRKEVKRRSIGIKKGDTAKIVRGSKKFVGKQGKVTAVNRMKMQVLIEGITRKRVDGTEKQVPFRPSNLVLVAIDEQGGRRLKKTKGEVKKNG